MKDQEAGVGILLTLRRGTRHEAETWDKTRWKATKHGQTNLMLELKTKQDAEVKGKNTLLATPNKYRDKHRKAN